MIKSFWVKILIVVLFISGCSILQNSFTNITEAKNKYLSYKKYNTSKYRKAYKEVKDWTSKDKTEARIIYKEWKDRKDELASQPEEVIDTFKNYKRYRRYKKYRMYRSIKEAEEKGLVAHWKLNRRSSPTIKDSTSTDADGTIYGASRVTGKKGRALEFNGIDNYAEINSNGLSNVGEIQYGTISLWFKFNNPGSTGILPMFYLGESNNNGTTDNLVIEIGHGDANDRKLYYTVYNSNYEPILCFDSNQNLEENTWYHFAVVNSSTGNTGYLNGSELTNRHYNFGSSSDTYFLSTITNQEVLRLGYGWFGIDREFYYFNGALDDIRIYDEVLTSNEIADLAN